MGADATPLRHSAAGRRYPGRQRARESGQRRAWIEVLIRSRLRLRRGGECERQARAVDVGRAGPDVAMRTVQGTLMNV